MILHVSASIGGNQILEENSLAEHSRIERLAEDEMQMHRPSRDSEVIVQ